MKTVSTFIFFIIIGATAMAQSPSKEVKVETLTYEIVIDIKIEKATAVKTNTVARVYKFKNTRVKKELTFTTKRNKAKIA